MPFLDRLQKYDVPRNPDSIKLLKPNGWLHLHEGAPRGLVHWLSVSARVGRLLPMFGVNDRNFWRVASQKALHAPLFLDGYFQHGWTQASFAQALAAMPTIPVAPAAAARVDADEVVVHIRGGDFLKLPRFQVVDAHFYGKAARQAMEQGWQRFAVITDDPVYANSIGDRVSTEVSGAAIRIVPPATGALEDFDTLRAASARIIGNSTFAWWAAALGQTSPTWVPTKLTLDQPRDFYLPFETPLKEHSS